MTNETVAQPGTVALEPPSTVLNPETVTTAAGAGAPPIDGEDSIASVLETELARLREADKASAEKETKDKADDAVKDAKAKVDEAEKAKKTEKPEKAEDKPARQRSEDGKFAKAAQDEPEAEADKSAPEKAAPERAGQEEQRQSEGRKHAEPPARFLPEARQKWANVPNEVKAEFHRVSQEMEGEITRYRQSSERYEQFRQFDEVARTNGRDLAKDSLPKIIQFENMMRSNPLQALEFALREAGPRKQDGTPLSLRDVVQYVAQNPQALNSAPQGYNGVPAGQQQPQSNPEIAQLRAELQAMRAETTIVPVLQRFAAEHPDYHALEPQIEAVLKSGVIDQIYGPGLSPEQKLSEAYRMAGGSTPSRSDPEAAAGHSAAEQTPRPVNPDAGKKSVRGAPADGANPATDEPETDLHEMLRKEMRKLVA